MGGVIRGFLLQALQPQTQSLQQKQNLVVEQEGE